MASIIKRNGGYSIKLSPKENPLRPKIGLGRVTKREAETARNNIEALVRSRLTGAELSISTSDWLSKTPDSLRIRLEKLDMVERTAKSRWTVPAWVADYIERRTDVKADTVRKWKDVQGKLDAFFKDDSIGDVTQQQAKNFRIYLQTVIGLGENTTRRAIGICRQFFNAAIEAEIITRNPFRGQPVSVRANESRFFYVTQAMAEKVLAACPDVSWKLIFGLARYGGLRCPSEVLRLKWQDVDFERLQFKVHASKTEHHADGGVRMVPMFPELRPLFQDAFDQAPEGAIYCLHQYKGQWSNLGVHMARIIQRAGLEPWPKIFQNLRSTRETELFRMTGGNVKAVCRWLGNSPSVALQHYAQTTEADLADAAKMSLLADAEKGVQLGVLKGVHTTPETSRKEPQDNQDKVFDNDDNPCNCGNLQAVSEPCENKTENVQWALLDLNQ